MSAWQYLAKVLDTTERWSLTKALKVVVNSQNREEKLELKQQKSFSATLTPFLFLFDKRTEVCFKS